MAKIKITKIALSVSFLMLAVWLFLGTTSSIAWFRDEDTIVNSLNFGNIDIDMYYKDSGAYKEIDSTTKLFDESILYEPGYTRVTYLKIVNSGSYDFTYDISVVPDLASTVLGTSVLGNNIDLADYIKFGLIIGDTEQDVLDKTEDRELAKAAAVNSLSQYSESGGLLTKGGTDYAALVIYFPEETGNKANYRGDTAPEVALGISAVANQTDN